MKAQDVESTFEFSKLDYNPGASMVPAPTRKLQFQLKVMTERKGLELVGLMTAVKTTSFTGFGASKSDRQVVIDGYAAAKDPQYTSANNWRMISILNISDNANKKEKVQVAGLVAHLCRSGKERVGLVSYGGVVTFVLKPVQLQLEGADHNHPSELSFTVHVRNSLEK